MNIKYSFLLIAVLLLTTGCYGPLRGKIVDAETGAPIEGAVAMAEWTRTKGFGDTYTVSVKVSEAVSDKEGNFELDGCYSPFVNKPDLTIYKKGYVAWNNVLIFPDWKKREGFEWKSGQIFGMEKFNESYSYVDHQSFIENAILVQLGTKNKNSFIMQYEKFEREKVIKERDKKERGEK